MILCIPSQFFEFLPGFRPLAPTHGQIPYYTRNCFLALLTPFLLIAAEFMVIGQGLPKRAFSIVEWS